MSVSNSEAEQPVEKKAASAKRPRVVKTKGSKSKSKENTMKSKPKKRSTNGAKPARAVAKKPARAVAKKPARAAKSNGTKRVRVRRQRELSPYFAKALKYAQHLAKEYKPTTVWRATSLKYKNLPRYDLVTIAERLKLNAVTAGRQMQDVRYGRIKSVDLG